MDAGSTRKIPGIHSLIRLRIARIVKTSRYRSLYSSLLKPQKTYAHYGIYTELTPVHHTAPPVKIGNRFEPRVPTPRSAVLWTCFVRIRVLSLRLRRPQQKTPLLLSLPVDRRFPRPVSSYCVSPGFRIIYMREVRLYRYVILHIHTTQIYKVSLIMWFSSS